jgi:hypothetical protein
MTPPYSHFPFRGRMLDHASSKPDEDGPVGLPPASQGQTMACRDQMKNLGTIQPHLLTNQAPSPSIHPASLTALKSLATETITSGCVSTDDALGAFTLPPLELHSRSSIRPRCQCTALYLNIYSQTYPGYAESDVSYIRTCSEAS